MIEKIVIKNFKAYENEEIILNSCNNIFIGENDCGKSTILQALDAFFNSEKIDSKLVRNSEEDVIIGVLFNVNSNRNFVKKIFKKRTYKLESVVGDFDYSNLMYIYIPTNAPDVKKLINDLALSKTMQNISSDIKQSILDVAEISVGNVLATIDPNMIVVDSTTNFAADSQLKLESAIKFDISTNGISLEGRGSGFHKNVVYALLTGGYYENVIIAIDEIENSLSINNAKTLLNIFKERFLQTLITTHSTSIVKVCDEYELYPILTNNAKTICELYSSLGGDEAIYILVEGKTDISWVKKSVELSNVDGNFIVIPCGGHLNIPFTRQELESNGYICKIIKDGDSGDVENSLNLDCIELYTPIDIINVLFNLQLTELPREKTSFFDILKANDPNLSESYIKNMISAKVSSFLTIGNPIVNEIKNLIIN